MALEASITPLRRQDGVLCSEPEFQFHLLDKAITADPRSTRTTDHLVLARTAGRLHSDNFPSSFGEGIPNSLRQLTLTNEKFGRLEAEDLMDDRIVRKLEKEGLF
jgi:hypothetical protein